jgi:hypothetical protein
MSRRLLLVALLCACVPAALSADPLPRGQVPAPLAPWVDWVLFDEPDHACPVVGEEAVCLWPGRLELDLKAGGGTFSQSVYTDHALFVALPGDQDAWPQEVRVNGQPAAVLPREGVPSVRLEAGDGLISGRLAWKELPETLAIPASTALVDLTVEGKPVAHPRREEDGGLLWLQQEGAASEAGEGREADRHELTVARLLTDGLPLGVTTELTLRVAGRAREVNLGPVLLAGTAPLSLTSDLPARLESNGDLRVQVRGGTWKIEVRARAEGVPDKLSRSPLPAPWPEEETWCWKADDALRQVSLEGARGVDPQRTTIRDDWKGFPAFLLRAGEELALRTVRRGEPEPAPDRLELQREAWMDLDGGGYTLRDTLSGSLSRTWRLDLTPPAVLGHVAVGGVDQLVTSDPAGGAPGVEVRGANLSLVAESRLETSSHTLPAVGWSRDVQQLGFRLNLPPGWEVLHVSGADSVSQTWVDSWTLLGFFVVLLVSLAVWKLTSWPWGLLALLALVLCHDQEDAPFVLWAALLPLVALLRVLPAGKLRALVRLGWLGLAVALIVQLVPFAVQQVRTGIYPQVREVYGGSDAGGDFGVFTLAMQDGDAPAAPTQVVEEPMAGEKEVAAEQYQQAYKLEGKQGLGLMRGGAYGGAVQSLGEAGDVAQVNAVFSKSGNLGYVKMGKLTKRAAQQDPNAVVQTGPGVPAWRWRTWHLSWNGPVERTQEVSFWLASPGVNLAASLLRVALALVLAGILLVRSWHGPREKAPATGSGSATATGSGTGTGTATGTVTGSVTAALLALLAAFPSIATAQPLIPDPDTLENLKERLLRPADCRPECVSTSALEVRVAGGTLSLAAEVHVGAPSSWRVPGGASNWAPARVRVDGQPSAALALRSDGFLHLRLGAGRHRVEAEGPVPAAEVIELELGEAPYQVSVDAPGWEVEGLRQDGQAEQSLRLSRALEAAPEAVDHAAPSELQPNLFPPWLEVTRTLDLGLPWLVQTSVRRVSPTGSPVLVRLPLLAGESITDADVRVENGHAVVSLGRDDTEVSWSGTLAEAPSLTLTAAKEANWSEVWVLRCSPIWQCAAGGVTPTHHVSGATWEPVFHPWPGEVLSITLARPAGVEGRSLTLDQAALDVSPGTRLSTVRLNLTARASQGGVHRLTLPEGAQVQSLSIDGRSEPIRTQGTGLDLSLTPGGHRVQVEWQQDGGMGAFTRVPAVDLGAPAANSRVTVSLPPERWLLFAGGPAWGPAILFWGVLLAAIVFAFILGRAPISPLKGWQWALLVLGLTQIPPPAALVVVGWFLAFSWRSRRPFNTHWRFDGLQVLLALWTPLALACLYGAVHTGLLMQPDMQVAGAGSTNQSLVWLQDRLTGPMPQPWVLSLPLWAWKGVMLAWSVWLAASLVRWLPWSWKAFSNGGLWIPLRRKKREAKGMVG